MPVMKYGSLCFPSFCKAEEECFSKENLLLSLSYDMAAKKRKKDLMNNNTKVPCESQSTSHTVWLIDDNILFFYMWGYKSRNNNIPKLCNTDKGGVKRLFPNNIVND